MRKKLNIASLLFLLMLPLVGVSEKNPQLNQEELPEAELTTEDWRSETEGMDFGDRKAPEPEEKEEITPPSDDDGFEWNLDALAPFILTFIIIVIAALIIYLVVRQLRDRDIRAEARDADTVMSLEAIEQNLPESDLERHLRDALIRKQHRVALRLYYLLVLQQLSKSGLIEWKREKTNYDYLTELQDHPMFSSFSDLTLAFERVWYGEQPFRSENFRQLEPEFKEVLNQLR